VKDGSGILYGVYGIKDSGQPDLSFYAGTLKNLGENFF
jgi:hypothetical protein